ncbi:OmpA family protein [Lentzea sp. NBRC 102530]|uniref:OmpA family protein n=1 Tax=Lentzea sp. NBRC 102530 TaxID=3032201 RepID=UPI0024A38D83|nr:OmpA family protein [Lentzea sp. NBRC 102530]GLY51623.1 hypothetical protein Lesp01_52790 [Lentzea sp. NBRC 102530]
MNDDLDEKLKARHAVHVADLELVLAPARLPAVPVGPPAPRGRVSSLARLGVAVAAVAVIGGTSVTPMAMNSLPVMSAPELELVRPSEVPPSSAVLDRTTRHSELAETRPSAPMTGSPGAEMVGRELVVVWFRPDSEEVEDADLAVLREFMKHLEDDDRVVVLGHTARLGAEDSAVRLSQLRADSVRTVLVNAGLSPARVTAVGVGYAQAAAAFDPRDRRVTVERLT